MIPSLSHCRRWILATVVVIVSPIAADTPPGDITLGPKEVTELSAMYDRFEQSLRQLPRDRFDSAAVIEAAGRDADALAGWVKNHTDPLPYRASLRGTTGVLMDRAGNSLDRSLLLAELLQSAGHEVRLANATLTPPQAQQVLAAASQPRKHVESYGDTPELGKHRERVKAQAQKLQAALGAVGDAAAENAARLAAVADHWWVQRKAGEAWIDVDVYGLAGLTPSRTLPPVAGPGQSPLAVADAHEVEFRAVIEIFRGGKLSTETVLKRTLRPADLLGKTVSFTHSVGSSLAAVDAAGDPAATAKLKTAIAGIETFIPILWIDERSHTEASFTTAGVVDRHPQFDPAGKLGGQVTSGFGALVGGGDSPKGPAGVLTAEWIEYEIRVPDSAPVVVRRPVFDLIGPAARAAESIAPPSPDESAKLSRALSMLGRTSILVQPCDVSPQFAIYQQARTEVRDKNFWLATAAGGKLAPQHFARGLQRLAMRDIVTPEFALIRAAVNVRPGATYIDRPNIIHHRELLEFTADGKLATRTGMDLAYTSTAGLGPDAVAARLEQGVADTLAELLVLGEKSIATENTIGVIETATAGSVAIRPADAAKLSAMNLPPDVRARANAALVAGNAIVVAGHNGRWAWWRVDPATGQTVGVMDNGFHAGLTEQEIQYEKNLLNYNAQLRTNVSKREFLNMKPGEMAKWANNNPNMLTNMQGLQQDWLAVIARRLAYSGRIIG